MLSYSRLYRQQRTTESDEQIEELIEATPPLDFAREYGRLKAKRES
jgi:hypothetical protein